MERLPFVFPPAKMASMRQSALTGLKSKNTLMLALPDLEGGERVPDEHRKVLVHLL